MGMASANPLVRTWAPDIDSELQGTVTCEGVELVYTTDGFPSHGVRVLIDDEVRHTEVVNDASHKAVLGTAGMLTITMGLAGQDYASGRIRVMSPRWSSCGVKAADYPDDGELPTTVPP